MTKLCQMPILLIDINKETYLSSLDSLELSAFKMNYF